MMTLGGDPGLDGAIALYDGRRVRCWRTPTLVLGPRGKQKRKVNKEELADLVSLLASSGVRLAALEQVDGVKNQSAHASCNFGRSAGYLEMAVVCNYIPYRMVSPIEWKTHFRLIGKDKDASRARASELLPADRAQWAKAGDDGSAEAALLALYAWHLAGNGC